MRKALALLICVASAPLPLKAKDFGVQGAVFPIREDSLLEVIHSRLKKVQEEGKLVSHQQEIQKRVRRTIEHPAPLSGITTAQKHKIRVFDPTLVVDEDIKDHEGKTIIRKGTKVNPLDHHSFGKPLVFIQGEQQDQLDWALKQGGKVVLVSGSPLYLSKVYKQPFYYDQGATLTNRFKIKAVPARVSQKGKMLLIEEFTLKERENP